MRAQKSPSPDDIVGMGVALILIGTYFILVALGLLPEPDDTTARAPAAIVVVAGAAFVFAGLHCMVRANAGRPDRADAAPDSAPRRNRLSYRALAIGVTGAMAAIGTWLAIGSGPRVFDFSAPFLELRTTGELVGRAVFGLGAVLVWFYVIALAIGTVRKFFGPGGR